tara:strand:+ start:65 stop:511 length:447 start_codon:yes stop_codon:yes gene_type:complete
MNKYNNGKIYKIIDENHCYIGSTTQTLNRRLQKHISNKKNDKIKMTSSKLNLDHSKIILIENCPCETKKQLLERERFWIDRCDCVNKIRPVITYDEKLDYNRIRNKNEDKIEYNRRRKIWRNFKSSWGFNNYLGTTLNLLDIDTDLFR